MSLMFRERLRTDINICTISSEKAPCGYRRVSAEREKVQLPSEALQHSEAKKVRSQKTGKN